jgi:hypothetical protein
VIYRVAELTIVLTDQLSPYGPMGLSHCNRTHSSAEGDTRWRSHGVLIYKFLFFFFALLVLERGYRLVATFVV